MCPDSSCDARMKETCRTHADVISRTWACIPLARANLGLARASLRAVLLPPKIGGGALLEKHSTVDGCTISLDASSPPQHGSAHFHVPHDASRKGRWHVFLSHPADVGREHSARRHGARRLTGRAGAGASGAR